MPIVSEQTNLVTVVARKSTADLAQTTKIHLLMVHDHTLLPLKLTTHLATDP